MNVTHTQLPWSLYRGEICYRSDEDDQSYGMQCPVDLEDDANAAFIVKAVNAHDALTAALQAFVRYAEKPSVRIGDHELVEQARAALAAAGEPV